MTETLAIVLMTWIGSVTGWHSDFPPPRITFKPSVNFVLIGAPANAYAFENPKGITLRNGVDIERTPGRGLLVHELAHYLQRMNGMVYRCQREKEAAAYRIQAAWLALSSRRDTLADERSKWRCVK